MASSPGRGTAATALRVIEPGSSARNYWTDLWRFRELMFFLAWRDVIVRYKQTAIGVAWAVLRPALTMLVFVAFRRMVGLEAGDVPEPIFVFAAVLPWQFFSTALTECSNSVVSNANLISKVYFPRLIVPVSAVATSLVDLAVSFGLLALLMVGYGYVPGPAILALPVFVALAFAFSLGLGVFLAALNVEYRDFRFIVPFIVQFGLFISPIAFTTANVPEQWRPLYALNPMVAVIDGFRWAITGAPFDSTVMAIGASVAGVLVLLGFRHFRNTERRFADII